MSQFQVTTSAIPRCVDEPEGECQGNVLMQAYDDVLLDKMQADIMAYPFNQVRYRLEHDGRLAPELIEEAITEFRKYLIICLRSDKPVAMISPDVDEVWHAFILFTKDYTEFTTYIYGTYLHHTPNTPFAEGGMMDGSSGQHFREMYSELYGALPDIWTRNSAERCTKSCSGGETDCSCERCNSKK